jgi:hypothetical protein
MHEQSQHTPYADLLMYGDGRTPDDPSCCRYVGVPMPCATVVSVICCAICLPFCLSTPIPVVHLLGPASLSPTHITLPLYMESDNDTRIYAPLML